MSFREKTNAFGLFAYRKQTVVAIDYTGDPDLLHKSKNHHLINHTHTT